jgi:hypothetical protein
MTSLELARTLAEIEKRSPPSDPFLFIHREEAGAIITALCIQAAVEEGDTAWSKYYARKAASLRASLNQDSAKHT